MTAATDPVTYVYWHRPDRMTFPVPPKDIKFVPSKNRDGEVVKNRISVKLWDKIKDGVGKHYTNPPSGAKPILVECGPPVDGETVHDVDIRRGIVQSSASRRAKEREDAASSTAMLQVQVAALQAQIASMNKAPSASVEPVFDPKDLSLEELSELIEGEGMDAAQLAAMLTAEIGGKSRQGAIKILTKAINAAG